MSVFNKNIPIKEEYDPNTVLERMMNMVAKINAIKELYGQEEIRSYGMTGEGNPEAEGWADNDIATEIRMMVDYLDGMANRMKALIHPYELLLKTYSDDAITVKALAALDSYLDKNKYNKIVNYQIFDILIKLYESMDFFNAINKSSIDGSAYQVIQSFASRIHFPESAFVQKNIYQSIDAIFQSDIIYINATAEQYMKTAEYLLYNFPKGMEGRDTTDFIPIDGDDSVNARDIKIYGLSIFSYMNAHLMGLYKTMINQFVDIARKINLKEDQ